MGGYNIKSNALHARLQASGRRPGLQTRRGTIRWRLVAGIPTLGSPRQIHAIAKTAIAAEGLRLDELLKQHPAIRLDHAL